MRKQDFNIEPEEEIEYVSRSQMKREVEALQDLGKKITELRPDQQAQVPMSDVLAEAVEEMARISSHGAKKRHLNYIGKLMKHEDEEAIKAAIERFDSASDAHNQRFHALERLRERLIDGDQEAMNETLAAYPDCDIQHIRQLIRNAQKEREQNKPPASFRKLFQYLRTLDESV